MIALHACISDKDEQQAPATSAAHPPDAAPSPVPDVQSVQLMLGHNDVVSKDLEIRKLFGMFHMTVVKCG